MSSHIKSPVVIQFVGASGSGKTTLMEKLLRILGAKGIAVGVVKHAHHGFDIDRPGKDSYRYSAAGAKAVAVVSPERTALLFRPTARVSTVELLRRTGKLDVILMEGFTANTKEWCFHVVAKGRSKTLRKGPKYLGIVTQNEPSWGATQIATFLIKKFNLGRK